MLTTDVEGDHARQALAELLATEGMDTPSLRGIARTAGVSAATLLSWFGSKATLHIRVLDVVTARLCRRLQTDLFPTNPGDADSPAWVRQRAEQARADLRLRLAFAELARTDEVLAEALGRTIEVERQAIRRAVAAGPAPVKSLDDAQVELLHLVLLGLWSRMCEGQVPLAVARARELWAVACGQLAG